MYQVIIHSMLKKIISVVIASVIAFTSLCAQSKREIKAIEKEAKTIVRQFEKEGFKFLELGNQQELVENYLYGARLGYTQIIGTATESRSLNLGKNAALTNAINEHVSVISAEVTGRISSNSSSIDGKEREDIIAAFERNAHSTVRGEVRTCFTLIRERKNRYDVRVYCLVDYDAAHAAHMRAMKMALEELELAQEYGDALSDWID